MGDIAVSVVPTEELSIRQREAIVDVCIRVPRTPVLDLDAGLTIER